MDGTLAAAAEAFRDRPRRGVTPDAIAAESRELTKFVAAMGGTVRIESSVEKGTSVMCVLPQTAHVGGESVGARIA